MACHDLSGAWVVVDEVVMTAEVVCALWRIPVL